MRLELARVLHGAAAMVLRPAFGLPVILVTLLSLGGVIGACSSDDAAATSQPAPSDAAPPFEEDAEIPDAADAAPPKAPIKVTFPEVQSRGGPVIKTPRVVPIIFTGDPLASQITEFTAKVATSSYWKTLGAEYGVGPITPGATLTLAETAPTTITSSAIETWLVGKLTGASPAFGAPDANTLYAIYYPASTTIMMEGAGAQGQSCQGYGGYHFEVNAGGTQVGFAVMPRCSDLTELTVAASHEYFEWATDPFPQTKPAYAKLDDAHWAWQATMIGELGDLCTFLDRDDLTPPEIGFTVQRQWSNKASLAGKYPCAPTKGAPYLQAIPLVDDDVVVPDSDGTTTKYITTKSARVTPGGTKTIDVLVYSDQATTGDVPMRVMTYDEVFGTKRPPSGYEFSLDKPRAKVGETVHVTITAPTSRAYELMMMLTYTGPQSVHYWPIVVVNDDPPSTTPGGKPMPLPRAPAGLARANGRAIPTTMLGTKPRLAAPPPR